MSASFRSHFTNSTSDRATRPDVLPSRTSRSPQKPAPNEPSTRYGAKLAKKSSRLPATSDRREQSATPHVASSISPTSKVESIPSQRSAPASYSWDLLPPPPTLRTPSLVSGSSISTFDSPKANVLRRKRSTIGRYVADKKEALDIQLDREAMDDTILGIPMPAAVPPPTTVTPVSFLSGDAIYATVGTVASSSPSTRFTDSPFSYAPTPSSFSSISTAPTSYNITSSLTQELGNEPPSGGFVRQDKASRFRNSMLPTASGLPQSVSEAVHAQRTKPAIESRLPRNKTRSDTKLTKSPEPALIRKKSRQSINPPELAHLTSISPTNSAPAPVRPSREGANGITLVSPTSPVVQSDLPLATFHKRTPSRDSFASSSSSHGFRSRFGLSPKPSSEQELASSETDPIATGRKRGSFSKPVDPRTSEITAPVKSRFGFLTKKNKDDSHQTSDKPRRESRKMPAAGTGHERYGRFGFGQRNASVSNSIGSRSPSSDSLGSTKSPSLLRRKSSGASDKTGEMDEFLRNRLTPVVLRGSGARAGSTSSPSVTNASGADQMAVASDLDLTLTTSQTPSFLPSPPKLRSPDDIRPSSANAIHNSAINKAQSEIKRPSTSTPVAADGGEALWLRTGMEEKKAPKKWNFLQRLHHSPAQGLAANAVNLRSNLDNAAHSALMDAIEPIELVEVEEIVKADDTGDDKIMPDDRMLLPAVDIAGCVTSTFKLVDSTSTLHTPELGSDSPRVPRLSPIGRIPQIVSKRDRERKLPDTSFSRPFVNTQPRPNVKPPGALYNQIREHASPNEPVVIESPQEQFGLDGQRQGEYVMHSASNLFTWPSRKNSDFSYTSSSDTASWLAYSRMQAMQDEDVWEEFNDFMDDAALGKPSNYHKMSYATHSPPYREPILMQDASYFSIPVTQPVSYFGRPPTREPNIALPTPPLRLSRDGDSKINVPVPPPSLWTLTRSMTRHSVVSGMSVDSSRNSRVSTRSRAASFGEVNMRSSHTSFSSGARLNRDSIRAQAEAHSNGLHATVNVKLDSLMTSKLLSFGRVLFSPAHNEMRLADEPRVLILDGLGSDWSYFVAMFYPQATIYNLGPSGKQSGAREGIQQLPNHRNIAHSDLNAPLPFPKGFFTAAVFRFPIAATDQAYHTCIAEFKRVLRPGGHLEVTVLDIDLGNAGDCARRAVRGLKTRLQQRQENVSLRSLSDFMLQAIGKRGFEAVQRCIIGVPVMSRSSHNSGSSSSSDNGKASHRASDLEQHSKAIASLVEYATLQDSNAEESSDEKMTKTVARVGRWWYSQCYERSILNTDRSIWADAALLSECQTQNTSFKLLICYAQKPSQARRRTMSV